MVAQNDDIAEAGGGEDGATVGRAVGIAVGLGVGLGVGATLGTAINTCAHGPNAVADRDAHATADVLVPLAQWNTTEENIWEFFMLLS
jgi:hypothetical protein